MGPSEFKRHEDAEKTMGWSNVALQYLRVYCGQRKREPQPVTFIASDVRRAAAQYGLDIPFEAHEWGPVLQKAAKLGLIADDGWTTDPHRKYGRTTKWLIS